MRRTTLGLLYVALTDLLFSLNVPHIVAAAPLPVSVRPANTVSVTIANFSFSPTPLHIASGTTVVWSNTDTAVHTVTSDPGMPVAFDSGDISHNGAFTFIFTDTGTYTYHCAHLSSMQGTIIVDQPASNNADVHIANFAFDPSLAVITPGISVKWKMLVNIEEGHSVQSTTKDGNNTPLFASPLLHFNDTYSFAFANVGIFPYICTIHSRMLGFVIVNDATKAFPRQP